MKKKKLILASSIGIVVVIGAVVAALVLTSALAPSTRGNAASAPPIRIAAKPVVLNIS